MRIDDQERAEFLDNHEGWIIEGETLSKVFVHKDFNEAMGFVNRVALLSEVADHHPDIDIRWNKVTIVLSTHSESALTEKDTTLAESIEAL